MLRVFSLLFFLPAGLYTPQPLERRMLMQLRQYKMLLVIVAGLAALSVQFVVAGTAHGQDRLIFSMDDPKGDDFGPGTYMYPTHEAFSPHKEILDLTRFEVVDTGKTVDFYFTFAKITNPWHAPEGFSHPLIDLFIDCIDRAGRDRTLRSGPRVRFASEWGWDYLLRVVAWDGCRLFRADDPALARGTKEGISCSVLPENNTIKVSVSRNLFEVDPDPSWKYYCLVGAQDVFGEDEYRPVMREAGLWHFGGAEDERLAPYVIDLLAPDRGPRGQRAQLLSYDSAGGVYAMLYPVGGHAISWVAVALSVAVVLLLIGVGIALVWVRRNRSGPPPGGI